MYVSWSIHPSAGWHLCAIDTKNRKKLGLIFVVGSRLLSIANPAGSSVAVKCVVAIVTLSDLLFLIWYPPFSPSLSLTVCSLGSPRTIRIVAFIVLLSSIVAVTIPSSTWGTCQWNRLVTPHCFSHLFSSSGCTVTVQSETVSLVNDLALDPSFFSSF